MVLSWSRDACICRRMYHQVSSNSAQRSNIYLTNPTVIHLSWFFSQRIAQPLFLGQLIKYFSYSDQYKDHDGYIFAGAVVLASGFYTFTHHPFFFGVQHVGMQIRIACCSLVYRKVSFENLTFISKFWLRLSSSKMCVLCDRLSGLASQR